MNNEALRFADFDFEIDEQRFKLPDKKVEDVRLIVIDRQAGSIAHDMFTNLHVPMSTHVVMASTFGGRELIIDAYEEASRMGYEFGIHGDAMLIIGDHEPSSYQEG
jgi:S-adenosylmethionine:tRNA-ribosyltransferase-isomerase (queuine synthetase)